VLNHIGFDVKDHQAVRRRSRLKGISLNEPVRKSPTTGNTVTYIKILGVPASR
jgi:hypothetical protein